jgi:hypothetical protein
VTVPRGDPISGERCGQTCPDAPHRRPHGRSLSGFGIPITIGRRSQTDLQSLSSVRSRPHQIRVAMPLRRAGESWWLPRNSGMPVASVDELVKEIFGVRCRAAACRPGHLCKRAQFRDPIVAAPIDCETGHIAALILDQVRTSMLSLCTSRCRWTNACEPRVQHFYTSRADPRHSKRGWTSPAPAVAHWRGCLRTIRGCALSTGGVKPRSPTS